MTMAFYDSVKDDVREEHGEDVPDGNEEGEEDVAFDTLKEGADQYSEKPDEEQEDTEIEVVGDGLDDGPDTDAAGAPAQEAASTPGKQSSGQDREPAQTQGSTAAAQTEGVARDEVVSVLKTLEQQNSEMLDVLRGIKRSLDTDS